MKAPSPVAFIVVALLVLVSFVALVAWLGAQYRESDRLRHAATHAFDRQLDQIDLLSHLKDAETAQRGYLLTGNAEFLQPYEPARRRIASRLAVLARTRDADFPAAYIPKVRALAMAKFAELDRTIALYRGGQREAARRAVVQGRGKRLMDRLRASIGAAIDAEALRSAARTSAFLEARARAQALVYAVVGGLVLVAGIFLFAFWRLWRQRHATLVDAFEVAERHSTILDSTIDAILILNPSGTVETMNAAATTMLGYGAAELERRDVATILDIAPGAGSFHERIGLIHGRLRRSLLADRIIRHRDGREIPVDIAMGVMAVPSGDHVVVSLRDISERKRIERVKDDLMSTVSHELRTPLTSIVGSLGLLRAGAAGAMSEQAGRLVEIAENNSRRLIRLINDMLDIDRIESGQLRLARVPTDLRTVIANACLGSEGLARGGDVTLACDDADRPIIVSGDLGRLVQVVTNLLSNAIRAAPEGSAIDLRAQAVAGRALLFVEDRGPGIPAEFRDRIFGRFERAQREEGASGTGLGLAISREIVTRHQGRLWFEDRTGGGTRFVISLPLLGAVADDDAGAPTVLVCEADDALARDLIAIVVVEGFAFERVRSAAEARLALARRDFTALLVGLKLPDEGGVAFAQAVHGEAGRADLPIIVVAATAIGAGDHPSAMDVVAWIRKPGDADRLALALRSALSRSDTRRPVILHLDDDRDLLEVVAASIEPEAQIVAATDLAEARAILQRISPDVAILDITLAEGSGLELIPFLVDADGRAIPTIVYTAQDVSGDLARSVDAVIVKAGSSIPDLKATIRRVVRSRRR